jgi:hypothetical protein
MFKSILAFLFAAIILGQVSKTFQVHHFVGTLSKIREKVKNDMKA